jgi:transposase
MARAALNPDGSGMEPAGASGCSRKNCASTLGSAMSCQTSRSGRRSYPSLPSCRETALDRALVAGDAGRVTGERQERPDPEVPEKARRRTFTAQYKQDVLAAYEAAPDGEKGAILRREGLYSSLISEWRRARDAGALAGLKQPPGRPAADPRDAQIARLRKEKAKLEQELARARFVVDVQSKLQALLDSVANRSGW